MSASDRATCFSNRLTVLVISRRVGVLDGGDASAGTGVRRVFVFPVSQGLGLFLRFQRFEFL